MWWLEVEWETVCSKVGKQKKKGETVLNRPYREINIYTKIGKIP